MQQLPVEVSVQLSRWTAVQSEGTLAPLIPAPDAMWYAGDASCGMVDLASPRVPAASAAAPLSDPSLGLERSEARAASSAVVDSCGRAAVERLYTCSTLQLSQGTRAAEICEMIRSRPVSLASLLDSSAPLDSNNSSRFARSRLSLKWLPPVNSPSSCTALRE